MNMEQNRPAAGNSKSRYEDIIRLPHHVSGTRPRMSMAGRAAQFSPFAALSGFGEAVKETGRLTEERIELEEDAAELLDEKLRLLAAKGGQEPEIRVVYFKPDERKSGGAKAAATGCFKKIDEWGRTLVMADGMRIALESIIDIEILSRSG